MTEQKPTTTYIARVIEPGEYFIKTQEKRMMYGIHEGDTVKICHVSPMTEIKRIVKAKVFAIDEHHITLEFPAGYRMSLQWHQFLEEEKEAASREQHVK